MKARDVVLLPGRTSPSHCQGYGGAAPAEAGRRRDRLRIPFCALRYTHGVRGRVLPIFGSLRMPQQMNARIAPLSGDGQGLPAPVHAQATVWQINIFALSIQHDIRLY